MSLHTDNDRGRWKNFDPRLDPPPAATRSSYVVGGKLTFRNTFVPFVDDGVSSDIPNVL